MKDKKYIQQALSEKRQMIFEMISASVELSEKLGKHPLTVGCNCIACVNKRKRLLDDSEQEWKFKL